MQPDDEVRVKHIFDAAAEALSFIEGRSAGDVYADRMLARALVNCVEVIGEAASHLSQSFRDGHSAVDWPAIIGMRHRLIHAYFDINYAILWSTITEDVPRLVEALQVRDPES